MSSTGSVSTSPGNQVQRSRKLRGFFFVMLAALLLCGCRKTALPPYSPTESLSKIKIAPGYRIEPFLSEPDVVSPVAMEFDENGSMYVVEDRGYPLNVSGKVGRIKLIRDTNGDG